jgi:hypothetical protein
MIPVSIGTKRPVATISVADPKARFQPAGWFTAEIPVDSSPLQGSRSLMAEVNMARPYGCVGGTLEPGEDRLTIRVAHSGSWQRDGIRYEGSSARQAKLLVGLPDECAFGAFVGIVDAAKSLPLASGVLTVDFAVNDPIESSLMSFKMAGGLLLWALLQVPDELDEERLSWYWEKWSREFYSTA